MKEVDVGLEGRMCTRLRFTRRPFQEMEARCLWTVVTTNRRQLAELEYGLIQNTHRALAGETRVLVACVAQLGAESLACSSDCAVCWDGH
jgi:hypothetical protein